MPTINITAQLIRITRAIQPGQWLLIHPDERYEVLSHEQAMTLQGKRTVPTGRTYTKRLSTLSRPTTSTTMTIQGKTIHIEPQKVAILQYMAEHGPINVSEASTLLGSPKTSILSSLKSLGLVTSNPDPNHPPAYLYSITNEGRAIAQGTIPHA